MLRILFLLSLLGCASVPDVKSFQPEVQVRVVKVKKVKFPYALP
jgi:hypothetical protein